LRTPLNAIAGYVDLLAMELRGPVTEEQREDLHRILQNERHLASLIEDILNYAKLEAGRIEYDINPVDVTQAIADAASLMSAPYGNKGVALRVDPGGRAITALGDSDRLRQVLLNLLSNAVKFTPAGGTVALTGRVQEGIVEITCADSGLGIPPDKL